MERLDRIPPGDLRGYSRAALIRFPKELLYSFRLCQRGQPHFPRTGRGS